MRTDPFDPIELAAPEGDRAHVLPHSAHVTSWVPAGGGERLFESARARREPGAAVRGGIPVVLPQFAALGPLPKHGFTRSATWRRADAGGDPAAATLRLADSPATRAAWPHAFVAELTARVGAGSLAVSLRVTNRGGEPLAFTAALHTYLRVSDVRGVAVAGPRGVRYRDGTAGGAARVEEADVLRLTGETDRVYVDAPPRLMVRDGARAVRVDAEGFPDAVVWNPWAEGARGLDDMGPDGWLRMLCVESAAVATPVRVAPGSSWTGRQTLVVADRAEAMG